VLRKVFEQIDWLNRGYINKSDVKRIIDMYSDHVSQITLELRSHPDSLEMEAMFRRFNKDK
jgi:glutamyl/glutaminyl-tRNA synthetase